LSGQFKVRVENIQFDAAHFVTFGDSSCEPLHGHSYAVAAEIEGDLNTDSLVVDFTLIKALLRGFSKELDHRFILQLQSRKLEIVSDDSGWRIRTPTGAGYVFPKQDVAALPIDNSSAERLSEWFSGRLVDALQEKGARLRRITVEVSEGPGQMASHRIERLPLD
jgi:6-pyruvoyltetrahydropterin/6-carboxytetrahydropterin synthase